MNLIQKLKTEMDFKSISVYKLSQLTGIRYELLRRVFTGERKLVAEELILVLERTGIDFNSIK